MSASQQAGKREPDLWTLAKYDIVDLLFGADERRRQHIVDGIGRGVRNSRETGTGHGGGEGMSSSIGNVNAAVMRTRAQSYPAASFFWAAWVATLGIHVALAMSLLPFGDEAWYWQESRSLDWSFSDIPAATAGLIRAGEALFGVAVYGGRLPFLAERR